MFPPRQTPFPAGSFSFPKERLISTDLTMDEGLTLVLSGGLLTKEEKSADSQG
jgi:uncharacterized membrane protein